MHGATTKTKIHFWSYLAHFFLEWKMFQTKFAEKIESGLLCSLTFFRKSLHLWYSKKKYCRAGRVIDDNMTHAHRLLDNYVYKNTPRFYLVHVGSLISLIHTRNWLMHTRIVNNVSLRHVSVLKDASSGSKIHFDSNLNSFCWSCFKMTGPLLRCNEELADDNTRFVYIFKLLKETISNGSKQHRLIFNVKSVSGPVRHCITKGNPTSYPLHE
jgi:hypothetical protein